MTVPEAAFMKAYLTFVKKPVPVMTDELITLMVERFRYRMSELESEYFELIAGPSTGTNRKLITQNRLAWRTQEEALRLLSREGQP